jgi:hypothetical protein
VSKDLTEEQPSLMAKPGEFWMKASEVNDCDAFEEVPKEVSVLV